MFASATFLGAMLGSAVGGYLAEPKGRVPLIGDFAVFADRPYIAPGLAMGLAALLVGIALFCVVPEVSTVKEHRVHINVTRPVPVSVPNVLSSSKTTRRAQQTGEER
jgi:MFS family permease